ncbi:MAG: DUF6149 family protein [Haloarculaceae archaeon]
MQIGQGWKHFAVRTGLTLPVASTLARRWLVNRHVREFTERSPDDREEERRAHLRVLFATTNDAYEAALREGFHEAPARETTQIEVACHFWTKGWTELMQFPADELDAHLDRYDDYFARHGVDRERPLGEFVPPGGLPPAPDTPERREDPDYPSATPGYADGLYAEAPRVDRRR